MNPLKISQSQSVLKHNQFRIWTLTSEHARSAFFPSSMAPSVLGDGDWVYNINLHQEPGGGWGPWVLADLCFFYLVHRHEVAAICFRRLWPLPRPRSQCKPFSFTLFSPKLLSGFPSLLKIPLPEHGGIAEGRAWGSLGIRFCLPRPRRASSRLSSGPVWRYLYCSLGCLATLSHLAFPGLCPGFHFD